uniref:Uncharacterized protein n=1 Tax=Rhabditophanes sp. KR3021 TaxID=114890 RepID=A0AC35TN36_9BILA
MRSLQKYLLIGVICYFINTVYGSVVCPEGLNGRSLTCAFECCQSFEGENNGYYCCGANEKTHVSRGYVRSISTGNGIEGAEPLFMTHVNGFQVDYTLLVIGLIISIILSVIISIFCCFLCNGCWLHRRRNPQDYNGPVQEQGFIPVCCGFGIPTGTLVFSTHPPQVSPPDQNLYGGSSMTSLPSSRNRVRFNNDGTPRGVLKHNNTYDY